MKVKVFTEDLDVAELSADVIFLSNPHRVTVASGKKEYKYLKPLLVVVEEEGK